MAQSFMPTLRSLEELREHQLRGLQWTVAHAYNGSAFYRERLDRAGVRPQEIQSLEDIRRLPFTTANDLREGYPFPLLSVPLSEVVRIHASSGTTGKRKILAYTSKDLEDWIHFFARCYEMAGLSREDRVQIAVGYGIWTAGVGFQLGCERFGAMAIPVGPGNIEMQCEFLVDLQSTVMCSTASMALLMAEEIQRRGLRDKIALKKLIYGSERSSEAMRRRIAELMGLDEMFDIPGMTELYGPGTGLECCCHQGIHYWADYYILEILDPMTLEPVPEGEIGEMVVTTLCKDGGSSYPIPHQGLDPGRAGRLRVRLHPAQARQDPGPIGRHDNIQGREHLPRPDRPDSIRDPRHRQRVPGDTGQKGGREGLHDHPGGEGPRAGGVHGPGDSQTRRDGDKEQAPGKRTGGSRGVRLLAQVGAEVQADL